MMEGCPQMPQMSPTRMPFGFGFGFGAAFVGAGAAGFALAFAISPCVSIGSSSSVCSLVSSLSAGQNTGAPGVPFHSLELSMDMWSSRCPSVRRQYQPSECRLAQ